MKGLGNTDGVCGSLAARGELTEVFKVIKCQQGKAGAQDTIEKKDFKWKYSYFVWVRLLEASTFIKLSQYIFYLLGGIWRDTIQMEKTQVSC